VIKGGFLLQLALVYRSLQRSLHSRKKKSAFPLKKFQFEEFMWALGFHYRLFDFIVIFLPDWHKISL
jgi:hypothetical protein